MSSQEIKGSVKEKLGASILTISGSQCFNHLLLLVDREAITLAQ